MNSRSDRQRMLLGVHMTVQAVVFVAVALALTTLVGFAVLRWLEHSA